MIQFKKIRFKNIFSYGNTWTEIDLARSRSTMVTGQNGAGKSTFLDALSYSLFGKAFRRINKNQLVNTKNRGGLLTETEFLTHNGDDIKVVRGIKPEIFQIWVNGRMVDQDGASRDYQQFLEKEILGFDYTIFTQLILVGKATHVSFMRLDPNKRRQFVESILNLEIFSVMSKIHQSQHNETKQKFQDTKNAIDVLREKIKVSNSYIKRMENLIDTNKAKKIEELKGQISEARVKIANLTKEVERLIPLQREYRNLENNLISCKRDLTSLQQRGVKLNEKAQALSEPVGFDVLCPHCNAEFTHIKDNNESHRLSELEKIQKKLNEVGFQTTEKWIEIRDIDQAMSKLNEDEFATIDKNGWEISRLEREITELKKKILEEGEFDDLKKSIAKESKKQQEMSNLLSQLIEKAEVLGRKIYVFSLITQMLKDGGIKASFIRRLIPVINFHINKNLANLGFFAKFNLDEEFEETIYARGLDALSYNSFSEGEKLRIDMAILLAWRELARMHNRATTNLLVFDEIFDGSLDSIGTESLSGLLSELKDANIFIITHSPEKLIEHVDSSISISRTGGFSKLD